MKIDLTSLASQVVADTAIKLLRASALEKNAETRLRYDGSVARAKEETREARKIRHELDQNREAIAKAVEIHEHYVESGRGCAPPSGGKVTCEGEAGGYPPSGALETHYVDESAL